MTRLVLLDEDVHQVEGLAVDLIDGRFDFGWPHVSDLAVELFREEHAALTDAEARRAFEALYPLRPDGTRRSIDTMFTGGPTAIGMVHGMAGFIPAGIDQDDGAVRDIVAATWWYTCLILNQSWIVRGEFGATSL